MSDVPACEESTGILIYLQHNIYLSIISPFYKNKTPDYHVAACEEGPGIFAHFLTGISLLLVAAMLPFSLIFVVKVVQVRRVRRVCQ